MQLTNKKKQDIVTKIRASNTFSSTSTSTSLLQYLYDATLKGGILKEEVIDAELYGKVYSTDKVNTRVRVNVFNLRKKLELYYKNEGKDDKWQLVIEKGQYQVSFINAAPSLFNFKAYKWSLILPYLTAIVSLALLICTNIPTPIPSIWRSITSKDKVVNLYVGDVFGMAGITSTGLKGWMRCFEINSYPDYNNLLNRKPELKKILEPSEYTYASSMAVIATQRLQHFFQERDRSFNIRFVTKSSTSEILESDAIYIGNTGNQNRFINFFNEANPYCKLSANTLEIKNYPTIRDITYTLNTSEEDEDYAIVSKYPAPNGSDHFVFFSRHDFGVTASVEYFTDVDRIKNFVNNYLNGHEYFTAIFKVTGHDRINTNLEIDKIILF